MMSIMIPFFIISTVILSGYLKKRKMFVANKFYLFTFAIILFIFPFISNNRTLITIMKIILSNDNYVFINLALSNVGYIFTYVVIISFVTLLQVCISIILLEKRIRNIKLSNTNNIEYNETKEIEEFKETKKETKLNLNLNKVFIDYCRMMN